MPDLTLLVPGHMVGQYQITELIGKGGFSQVWSAWDTHLKRVVALKIIPIEEETTLISARFKREAQIVTRLEHPHILPLYDFGEEPAFRYLVMRYLTGGSLAERIMPGRLPPSEVLRLMSPVASTLDYIHEHHIVHRDLKPGNILLDAQNLPYLTDFGLARVLSDSTIQVHSASGTLVYMPPEQLTSEPVTYKSDIYSFGILLYQLFTGSLPLRGEFVFALRQIHSGDRLPDATELNPGLPQGLNDILRQITNPDPKIRPESASEAMTAIAKLFEVAPVTPAAPPEISVALESAEYREREAASLLQKDVETWKNGEFTLSLTHFILLDVLLRTLPDLLNDDVRSLMLRGALEHDHQAEYWWSKCDDLNRQRACWHALSTSAGDPVYLRTLAMVTPASWAAKASDKILERIGPRLVPVTALSPHVLNLLEAALPERTAWLPPDNLLPAVDDALASLATGDSALAGRSATLIGRARRTRAALKLPTALGNATPILTAFGAAGALPREISWPVRAQLTLLLAIRQLGGAWQPILTRYAWAAAGHILSVALLVYTVYRSYSLIGNVRLLNTFGQGLLFGVIYGAGVWAARHIAGNLRIAPLVLRAALGTLVGGMILAAGFGLFQKLVYDDVIATEVSVLCGFVYVWGFAISVEMPAWAQAIFGVAGILIAYLAPWSLYLSSDGDIRPPFIFDSTRPESVLPMALGAALLATLITLGYAWRKMLRRKPIPASAGLPPAAESKG